MSFRSGVVMKGTAQGHFGVSRPSRISVPGRLAVGHKAAGSKQTVGRADPPRSDNRIRPGPHGPGYSNRVLRRLQTENAKLRQEAFKLTIEIRRLKRRV